MKNQNRIKHYQRALNMWGKEAQVRMAIEEMSELTTLLCHSMRENKNVHVEKLASEIADVRIMMEQLIFIFKLNDLVAKKEEEKLDRLRLYLFKEQSKNQVD